jgi:hypothetical protein
VGWAPRPPPPSRRVPPPPSRPGGGAGAAYAGGVANQNSTSPIGVRLRERKHSVKKVLAVCLRVIRAP